MGGDYQAPDEGNHTPEQPQERLQGMAAGGPNLGFFANRSIRVRRQLRYFAFAHLPEASLIRSVSQRCAEMAVEMTRNIDYLDDEDELAEGLRDLLRAKDCFVRAALDANQPQPYKHPR